VANATADRPAAVYIKLMQQAVVVEEFSGMEADMSNSEFIDGEAAAFHLSDAEIQLVARQQFVASIAVAIVLMLGVGLNAILPASHNYAGVSAQKVAMVQQPKFVVSGKRVAAATQYEIEAP
jgi:hypothetical protein